MTLTAETLIEIAMTNPANAEIARRLPALGLSQCIADGGLPVLSGMESSVRPACRVGH